MLPAENPLLAPSFLGRAMRAAAVFFVGYYAWEIVRPPYPYEGFRRVMRSADELGARSESP